MHDEEALGDEVRRIWNANAEWWDDRIGDGNDFQDLLIEPSTEELLELEQGHRVLDIACGAGRFARRMAARGASVLAFDLSERFIERARRRTSEDLPIEFRVLDATRRDLAEILGPDRFDRVVCSMALMDMVDIQPVFGAVAQTMRPGGHFVFSVTHPCFHSSDPVRFGEDLVQDGRQVVRSGVRIVRYRTAFAVKGEGIRGQPEPQYTFHRPMAELLAPGFSAGLVVSGLREPRYPSDRSRPPGGTHWEDMPEIPPVLVIRMTRPRNP